MRSRRKRVGVRELRQNLSVYLRRVVAGHTLEVTERGRAVAVLAPLPAGATALERLAAHGRVTTPVEDILKLGVPRSRRVSTRVSDALKQTRDERL